MATHNNANTYHAQIYSTSSNILRTTSNIPYVTNQFSSIFLAKNTPLFFSFFKILFFGLCFLVPQYFFVLCNETYIKLFSFKLFTKKILNLFFSFPQAFFITIWARKLFYFFLSSLNFLKRIVPSPLTLHQNTITTHMADGGFKFLCSSHINATYLYLPHTSSLYNYQLPEGIYES